MDAIREAINNVSLYEVKAAVRKAQNVVMNYTEMEAKVREATNNEPWGASSTLMNEIASGTYNYQLLNEIMPMIYKRFTEKSAEEWRQIYKALQLLEFLIKNGAEQVIDDARSHLSTIKMLRQFYYIDNAGKDQGVNVRNRAKELAELLSDVDRIRAERKKARQTKNKYIGVEGGLSGGFSNTPGSRSSIGRFGGFGSDTADFGGYNGGGVYGDGGGFGGRSASGFHDDGASGYHSRSDSRSQYEEYDEGDDRRPAPTPRRTPAAAAKPPPPKKKALEPDLLGGFDDPISSAPVAAANTTSAGDDDDFDDFQSAPTPGPVSPPLTSSASGISLVQPKPVSTTDHKSMSSLVGLTTPAITPSITGVPSNSTFNSSSTFAPLAPSNSTYAPMAPNYFTSIPMTANTTGGSSASGKTPVTTSTAAAPKKPSNDAFGNIWSQASMGVRKSTTPTTASQKTPSLQDMAKEKATAGIWGTGAASTPASSNTGVQKVGGGLEDLLG